MYRQFIDSQVQLGDSMTHGDREITPYSRSTTVLVPGVAGGLVWSRPGGLLIKESDGTEVVLRVRDETRFAQIALLAIGILGGLAAWLFLRGSD